MLLLYCQSATMTQVHTTGNDFFSQDDVDDFVTGLLEGQNDNVPYESITQLNGESFDDLDQTLMCMIETEDNEFAFTDLRDDKGTSVRDKEKNALKHLNIFLKKYHARNNNIGNYVRAEDLTYEPTEEKIVWWDNMMGCFFAYLAKEARQRGDLKRERLSYNSATGYASSLKAYFMNKFRSQQHDVPVFQPDRWRRLRTRLLSSYQEETRVSGKSLTNPHVASSRQDRDAIATGCIWMNSPRAAEFWHLNNTMTQFSGRGSEVALNRRSHLTTTEVNELHFHYEVIQSYLKRQKFGEESHVPVYPQRDSIHQDYYFSLIYRIVMLDDNNDFIFPEFANKAAKQSDSKSDSKVSGLWTTYFNELYRSFKCLSERMNEHLTSHHGKKGSNQLMAETPSVSGLAQIFRSGWELRAFHSVFDYVVGSLVMSHQAGKAVSGWTAKIGDIVVGGQPPTLADITENLDSLGCFVDHIFINDIHGQWPKPIRKLLVASLFRHYDEFLSILGSEPDGKFDTPDDHVFVARIKDKLFQSGVSQEVFDSWKNQVRLGFFNRNLPALAIENFPLHLGDRTNPFHQVMMDPRCFVDHMNSLSAHYQALHVQVGQQQSTINTLIAMVGQQQSSIIMLTHMVQAQQGQLAHQTQLLEALCSTTPNCAAVHTPISPSTTATTPSPASPNGNHAASPMWPQKENDCEPYVKRFTVAIANLGDTISEHFYFFFAERAKDAYQKELEMDQGERDKKQKRQIGNKFGRIKQTVKLMLRFCREYPEIRPTSPSELQTWQIKLREMAEEAEHRLRNKLYPDAPDKAMVQSAVVNASNAVKETIRQLEDPSAEGYHGMPSNMPEDMVSWFGKDTDSNMKRKRKASTQE